MKRQHDFTKTYLITLLFASGCILLNAFDSKVLYVNRLSNSCFKQPVSRSDTRSYSARGTPLGSRAAEKEGASNDTENSAPGKQETLVQSYLWNRRNLLIASAASAAMSSCIPRYSAVSADDESKPQGYQTIILPSGLKYIELREGTGPTPRYGQLLTISYTGYVKVASKTSTANANEPPPIFDKVDAYLVKHGNLRLIPGLDEGLHTVRYY